MVRCNWAGPAETTLLGYGDDAAVYPDLVPLVSSVARPFSLFLSEPCLAATELLDGVFLLRPYRLVDIGRLAAKFIFHAAPVLPFLCLVDV